MFRGVVAVVGGCEGPVRAGAEKKKAVKPVKSVVITMAESQQSSLSFQFHKQG